MGLEKCTLGEGEGKVNVPLAWKGKKIKHALAREKTENAHGDGKEE